MEEMVINKTERLIEYTCATRGKRFKKIFDVEFKCETCGKHDTKTLRSYSVNKNCRHCALSSSISVHGGSRGKHPLYSTWKGMRDRCRRNKYYSHVSWSNEWDSFSKFRDDVMSLGWEKGLEIDRINSDLGYSMDNIKLSSRSENAKRAMDKRWNKN
jgi:hypothetical protein